MTVPKPNRARRPSEHARTPANADANEPQRAKSAKLMQDRSRATQRRIVKAALHLWNSRGFDQGFDSTTVEEIAARAEVSRATVYYYFPKKEDILRELAWTTAEDIYESALRAMITGGTIDAVFNGILGQLGRSISRNSPAAVKRMLQVRDLDRATLERDTAVGGLTRAFTVALLHAQQQGELPRGMDAADVAETVTAIVMGCVSKWSILGDCDLVATLQRRVRLLFDGVRQPLGEAI